MPPKKIQKLDSDKVRHFQEDWKLNYFFYIRENDGIPLCLICGSTVSVCKKSNIERHYETKHKVVFEQKYPLNDFQSRKHEYDRLIRSLTQQQRTLFTVISTADRVTEASFRICHLIALHKKPFSEAEFVKLCFLTGAEALYRSFDNKENIIAEIKKLPLSSNTCMRRCEDLARDLSEQLVDKVKSTSTWSLAIDESTDITDIAQLLVFIRYFDDSSQSIHEDILTMLPLKNTTTGQDICCAVADAIDSLCLDWSRLSSVVTDGAPSMIGSNNGFVTLLKKRIGSKFISYHCIIHQQALSAKLEKGTDLEVIMTVVIKIVNQIKASSLNHRQFKALLLELEAEYGDLVFFNNVRWFSRGAVLERFVSLLPEIKTFLQSSKKGKNVDFSAMLNDNEFLMGLGILTDVSKHMNRLNKELQGKNKLISELFECVMSFKTLLTLFKEQVLEMNFAHFPATLQLSTNIRLASTNLVAYLSQLTDSFNERFSDFIGVSDLFLFVKNPFLAPTSVCQLLAEKVGNNKLECELELIGLKNQLGLKEQLASASDLVSFWCKVVPSQYKELKESAIKLLTMFGSTYLCESAFSNMNSIKSRYRSTLTDSHVQDLMRIALTSVEPRFSRLAKNMQNHNSH